MLAPEHRGRYSEVLRHDGGPAVLTARFERNDAWQWEVHYVYRCLRSRSACRCRPPAWPGDTPGSDHRLRLSAYGLRDGRNTLRLPRPGFLLVDCTDNPWYLTIRPVDVPPESPPRRRQRP
ncbi:hypothetical protein [Streptomyces sp. NPDC001380]|uniref:hypothetical protein n=1 Tax=Streptomyces sp. NPDC001380 TaxID=3364566 RepID=UPI0036BAE50D